MVGKNMAIQPGAPIQPIAPLANTTPAPMATPVVTPAGNPLAKHFRQPSIYIKLPSEGVWYDDSVITLPENGEIPVYPMTALDEITYRTADALFNGEAVVTVIRSCIPLFKDASRISTQDLDTVLIAIRLATYGHEMEFTSRCPECEEQNDLALDLREIMERIKKADFTKPVVFGDVEIHFKPLTFKEQNDNNTAQFEDQKTMESIPTLEISEEEKLKILTEAFGNISRLTLTALADSISMIKSGDNIVVDRSYIAEYLANCPTKDFEKIREKITAIRESGDMEPLQIVCNDCKHEYKTPFTMNVANFFG
tara:strand:+ start:990 stop:1919 length:930 start_codon:yes stop_codon:yes gene_type:complete